MSLDLVERDTLTLMLRVATAAQSDAVGSSQRAGPPPGPRLGSVCSLLPATPSSSGCLPQEGRRDPFRHLGVAPWPSGTPLLPHILFLLQEGLPEWLGVSAFAPVPRPPSLEHGSGRTWERGGGWGKLCPCGATGLDPATWPQFPPPPPQSSPVESEEEEPEEQDWEEDSGEGPPAPSSPWKTGYVFSPLTPQSACSPPQRGRG